MNSFYIGLTTDENDEGHALFFGCNVKTLTVTPFLLPHDEAQEIEWGDVVKIASSTEKQTKLCGDNVFEVMELQGVSETKPNKKAALKYQICVNHFLEEMGWVTSKEMDISEAAASLRETFSIFPDNSP